MFLVAIDHVNSIVMIRHMRRHCHLTPLKYLGQLPSLSDITIMHMPHANYQAYAACVTMIVYCVGLSSVDIWKKNLFVNIVKISGKKTSSNKG